MFAGIDIGSISSKIAIIDENKKTVFRDYTYNKGNPASAVSALINNATKNGAGRYYSLCATGSGRNKIGRYLNADLIKNEITAIWTAIESVYPNANTIIEIGGQDSKLISMENGEIKKFRLNSVCAAGTGSFIEQQAMRLGLSISQLADMALSSRHKAKFSGRCSVFAETEMINLQQAGYSASAIAAGLIDAVCENYLHDLSNGIDIKSPVVFCGGVSENIAVKNSFEKKLNCNIIVPEINKIAAAFGAALLAFEHYDKTKSGTVKLKSFSAVTNIDIQDNKPCDRNDCLSCGICGKYDIK